MSINGDSGVYLKLQWCAFTSDLTHAKGNELKKVGLQLTGV